MKYNYCPSCGTKNNGYSYCPNCGKSLNNFTPLYPQPNLTPPWKVTCGNTTLEKRYNEATACEQSAVKCNSSHQTNCFNEND